MLCADIALNIYVYTTYYVRSFIVYHMKRACVYMRKTNSNVYYIATVVWSVCCCCAGGKNRSPSGGSHNLHEHAARPHTYTHQMCEVTTRNRLQSVCFVSARLFARHIRATTTNARKTLAKIYGNKHPIHKEGVFVMCMLDARVPLTLNTSLGEFSGLSSPSDVKPTNPHIVANNVPYVRRAVRRVPKKFRASG